MIKKNRCISSTHSGFKYENLENALGLFGTNTYCPKARPLGAFVDNIAHSCKDGLEIVRHSPRTTECDDLI